MARRSIGEWMEHSGVKFGTSGARGLADAMTDEVCYAYTRGFLNFLRSRGELAGADLRVAVGGDLRPSTDRIVAAVCAAVADFGAVPVHCGRVPSPAVALYGFENGIPSIMVTGSHIPDDRNGIKFNMPRTEVLKEHEAGMMAEEVDVAADLFTPEGMFREPRALPTVDGTAAQNYVRRYLEAFPELPLAGLRVGVYQHSAVGRDVMVEILRVLGAEVVPLGRSDRFVPVDTEAIRAEDVALARDWASRNAFDAIVSSDGDSDRPLVADASGEWIRGDVLGVLCARYLGADVVVTPVSSNTVVELCGWFPEVRRTRIGSPYVIEAMMAASSAGALRVVGYEANGGFLIQTPLVLGGRRLAALPTRDCMIVILAVLLLARREGKTLAELVSTLPRRFTASDRLQGVPTEKSRGILAPLQQQPEESAWAAIERMLGLVAGGRVSAVDHRDGVRVTFDTGDIVHLRPSGNAPEFRCYTEASSRARAEALCAETLALVASLAGVPGPGPLH